MSKSNAARAIDQSDIILQHVSEFPFFDELPHEFLVPLLNMGEIVHYPKGTTILEQGSVNETLFFLISGHVSVAVDQQVVGHLRRKGDMFGEMSLLSSHDCSATIRAETPVDLLTVQSHVVTQEAQRFPYKAQASLYRLFSIILCEKLRVTNNKAKEFEKTNAELEIAKTQLEELNRNLEQKVLERSRDLQRINGELEKQNVALQASHNRLAQLDEIRQSTLSVLMDLSQKHLPDLSKSVENLRSKKAVVTEDSLRNVHTRITEMEKSILPLFPHFSSGLSLKDKRVLVALDTKKQTSLFKTALGGTGIKLEVATSREEALAYLHGSPFNVLMVTTSFIDLIVEAKRKYPNLSCVLLADEAVSEYLPLLRKHQDIENVIAKNEEDRSFTIKNLVTTINKMANQDIFGIDKYLLWGVELLEHPVTSSRNRRELIDQMSQHFQEIGLRSTLIHRCEAVAEELLMNAIYDAPIDARGAAKYNHLNRTEPVDLASHEEGRFYYACDGMYAAIAVSDPFGAMEKTVILDYLENNYLGAGGQLDANKGGGGRGLHVMIERADLLIFNVHKHVRTEVIALFQIGGAGGSQKSNPTFQFFYRDK